LDPINRVTYENYKDQVPRNRLNRPKLKKIDPENAEYAKEIWERKLVRTSKHYLGNTPDLNTNITNSSNVYELEKNNKWENGLNKDVNYFRKLENNTYRVAKYDDSSITSDDFQYLNDKEELSKFVLDHIMLVYLKKKSHK
jgi:hypothetical protein